MPRHRTDRYDHLPVYAQTVAATLIDPFQRPTPRPRTREETAVPDPIAAAAGEQDHDDPWFYASEEPADPPADTGRPADTEDGA